MNGEFCRIRTACPRWKNMESIHLESIYPPTSTTKRVYIHTSRHTCTGIARQVQPPKMTMHNVTVNSNICLQYYLRLQGSLIRQHAVHSTQANRVCGPDPLLCMKRRESFWSTNGQYNRVNTDFTLCHSSIYKHVKTKFTLTVFVVSGLQDNHKSVCNIYLTLSMPNATGVKLMNLNRNNACRFIFLA